MYTITNDRLACSLYSLFKKGVDVRIFTDDETIGSKGCHIQNLADSGIPVRHDNSIVGLMHHKFIVIDDEVLLNGSFNWTWNAVKSNNENLVFSSDQIQIKLFKEEFNWLWEEHKGTQLKSSNEVAEYLESYNERFVTKDWYNKDNTRSYLVINDVVPIKAKK